ncbi:MAG TPA: Calx-beta domain-containing protein, partial [Pyrinomonadaceae bacterium]|nr:Calx-beta domain-containing protein [Pyrinomonadaceae bacterium]
VSLELDGRASEFSKYVKGKFQKMRRTLNNRFIVGSLLLLLAVGGLSFSGEEVFSSGAATADDEVQIIITTYRNGQTYQTISTARRLNGETTDARAPLGNAPAAAGDIVLSQIYSNGGNAGSTYQNNYLELFNRTNNNIDISGWPIYIADATGAFNQSVAVSSSRGVTIVAGGYLLLSFGPASSNGAPVPSDFQIPFFSPFPGIPGLNLSPSGKVFITPASGSFATTCPLPDAQIVDFVGYGTTANCFEGSGPTGTTSNTTAVLRKSGGCTDSNNNAADFDVSAPAPRNSSSTLNFCSSAAPVIQFSQSIYSDPENFGSLGLLVTRTGNTSAASSVDYATSDTSGTNNCDVISGKASSRCDYITTLGTLQFAAGETFRLINIPIIDDAYAEGTETFNVTLSNPSGATLGTQAVTTVSLSDNEGTNGTNQIDNSGFFVRQHYIDFLNREPDAGGNNFWIGEIENCTPKPQCTEIKRINVSAAFFLSIEFHETGYLVERLYKTSFGDATGTSTDGGVSHQLAVPIIRLDEFLKDSQQIGRGVIVGQTGWEQVLENNKVAFINQFVTRSRFTTPYPTTLTPAQFVDALFANTGITPSSTDRNAAINEFGGAGTSADTAARARALRRIAENAAFDQLEKNRAFVLMQYFGYLRRNPNDAPDSDYSGYDFWLKKLNQFGGNFVNADMVKSFIISSEYRARFGPA